MFSGPGLALRFLELAVLLDELGYQRVDVLGFSWGGALASSSPFSTAAGAAGWC